LRLSLAYRAAILHEPGKPLSIETVTAGELQPHDVLVRIRAAGNPKYLIIVLVLHGQFDD